MFEPGKLSQWQQLNRLFYNHPLMVPDETHSLGVVLTESAGIKSVRVDFCSRGAFRHDEINYTTGGVG
jgi:hypothetical protein